MSQRLPRALSRRKKVIELDDSAEGDNEAVGNPKGDPSNIIRLDVSKRRLGDANLFRRRPLRKTGTLPPLTHPSSNAHLRVIADALGEGKRQTITGESERFRYAPTMAIRAKKFPDIMPRKPEPPPLPERTRGSRTISDLQMRHFLAFFEGWIHTHYRDARGRLMSDREIAAKMGLTQNEVSSWRTDSKRPGLPRALYLRKITGVSLDDMFGPE